MFDGWVFNVVFLGAIYYALYQTIKLRGKDDTDMRSLRGRGKRTVRSQNWSDSDRKRISRMLTRHLS